MDGNHAHVRSDPCQNNVGTAVTVVICLFRRCIPVLLLFNRLLAECVPACNPETVNIFTFRWDLYLHHFLSVSILDFLSAAEVFRCAVITLRTPVIIILI